MIDRIETLRQFVQTQRARWQRWGLLEALGWTLSGLWAYFLIAVLVDNLAHLPMLGRLATALGLLAVLAFLGRALALRWQQRHATEDEIALALERRSNENVQNRLINALQLSRESAQGQYALAPAVIRENCRQLSQLSLPSATTVQPAALWLLLAAALMVIGAVGWMWQPQRFASSAVRILLPFASVDPVYRTRLEVEPGNIEAAGDIEIRVKIHGERPEDIAILLDEQQRRSTQIVPVQGDVVTYTLKNVQRSLSYAVRGGDFTSPYYRIEVPTPARLQRVDVTYRYPEYLRLPEKAAQTSGELEAWEGTQAQLQFVFDQPVESARLLVRSGIESAAATPVELKKLSATEFTGGLTLTNLSEYALETVRAGRSPQQSVWYTVRVLADEMSHPTLTGLPSSGELSLDATIGLAVEATDDLGLSRAGLFYRKAKPKAEEDVADDGWIALQTWPLDNAKQFTQSTEFSPATFGVAEGERIEIAARASDFRPDRQEIWITGTAHPFLLTGDGSQLQLLYEQILKSEAELGAAMTVEQTLHQQLDELIKLLDNDPAADGNNADKARELAMRAAGYSQTQDQLRETSGRIAREMPAPAGSLRLSVAMLADSEMVRAIRILDSVATRDDAAGRRTSFSDARATAARTLQSLKEIHEQYVRFRKEWELAHMAPFLRMLADRQANLRDQSSRWTEQSATAAQQATGARRQAKLADLCGLAATAFSGLAERAAEAESSLVDAFAETAEALESDELKQWQQAAQQAAQDGHWSAAVKEQSQAAEFLDGAYLKLREAMADAARQLLAGAEEQMDSDLAGQADLEKLQEGYNEDLFDDPDGIKLEEIIHSQEAARDKKKKHDSAEDGTPNDYLLPDSAVPGLQGADKGIRQEFKNLSLAKAPGGEPSFPSQSDRKNNRVKPHIQEKFEDLVGDLLEEEDAMKENYETYNLNAAFNINETGDVSKQGGDLNSTAASSATGNQKPPTTNVGGISRVGRQGARSHGMAVGNESINRRGRDKVQEGQLRVPDQNSTVKETKSDDPQTDTSAGIGGRKVESDDAKFATADAGEWTDDMVNRLDKPQEKNSIVERQGARLDASVAEMLRDMNSKQEQTIERLKTIRKDLKNLYLPTEHLDQLIDQLQANLHSLNERPSSEIFRLQQETLQKVRGVLQVFHQAHSGFQASLPREQRVRGRVVDDPSRAAPPGYEEAVKTYYQRLAAPDRTP